jgi:hypothetical protein
MEPTWAGLGPYGRACCRLAETKRPGSAHDCLVPALSLSLSTERWSRRRTHFAPRRPGVHSATPTALRLRSLAVLTAGAGANHHSPGRPSTRTVPCFVDPCDLPITWPAAAYCRWVALQLPRWDPNAIHPSVSQLARSIDRSSGKMNLAMQCNAMQMVFTLY